MEPDQLISDALDHVADSPIHLAGGRPEAALVKSTRAALGRTGDLQVSPKEVRFDELKDEWTRRPGGVDVVADFDNGSGRLLIETKVDKPDEALWDALKLADICRLVPGIRCAYLAYAARSGKWTGDVDGADLFLGGAPRAWGAYEMIERWPNAWAWLLIGGRGIRPRRSTKRFVASPTSSVPLRHDAGFIVRAVRVAPVASDGTEEFDADGWPLGFEPPNHLREKVRAAEAAREAAERRAADADDRDSCHDYAWYNRWTDNRLGIVVAAIAHDDQAFECLRYRLATERGWSEEELRDRLDPLRPPLPAA